MSVPAWKRASGRGPGITYYVAISMLIIFTVMMMEMEILEVILWLGVGSATAGNTKLGWDGGDGTDGSWWHGGGGSNDVGITVIAAVPGCLVGWTSDFWFRLRS